MSGKLSLETKLDWLRLIRSDNVGPRTFRALINHYGGARAALDALPDLARRGGAADARASARATRPSASSRRRRRAGISLVALGEPDYPLRLADDRRRAAAARGARQARGARACRWSRSSARAMPRRPACKFAERLARDLGEAGFAIASGLARGIDARRASRQPRDRHRRGARRRPRPHLSARACGACRRDRGRRARSFPRCRSDGSRAPAIFRAATG